MHKILQPESWAQPKGYSNGMEARGRLVFVGGQIGWNGQCKFECHDLVGQTRQTLKNIVEILAEAGAGPEHITRMTWYLVNKKEYVDNLRDIGGVYREVIGRNFPPMTAVQVAALIEDEALVEIEVTAVVPE